MDRIELTDSEKGQLRAIQMLYKELEKKIEFCFGRDRAEIQLLEANLRKSIENRIDQPLTGYTIVDGAAQRMAG